MGLSGRKTKQRIGSDPRNLSWADNAAKFGQSYLSKLGWDPAKGLGANQDGRTSHIQVAQKLNMLGIGAGAPQGPDAIAWKQNRDYELLLKRLNEGNSAETGERDQGGESKDNDADVEAGQKRKWEGDDTDAGDDERKRAKKEKKEKKRKEKEKKNKRSKSIESSGLIDEGSKDLKAIVVSDSTSDTQPSNESAPVVRRHLAHRARFLRSKQLASQSSTAIAEILGISPSVSGSATPTAGPSSSVLTPTTLDESVKMELLTNSNKSVADYFKEKLAARSKSASASGTATPMATAPSGTDVKAELRDVDRGEDKPSVRFGIGASRVKKEEDEPPKMGLGSGMKFGNLMGGLGMKSPPFGAPAVTATNVEVEQVKSEEPESGEILKGKKSKKEKKKEKKSKKGKEPQTSEPALDCDDNERTERVEVVKDTEEEVERKERKRKDKEERKAKKKKERSIKDEQAS